MLQVSQHLPFGEPEFLGKLPEGKGLPGEEFFDSLTGSQGTLVVHGVTMRYLVMGAGALGTVLGGLLQHSGQAVAFQGRGAHYEHLLGVGLTITGIWGDYRLGPVAAPRAAPAAPDLYDIILLCVKSFDTAAAAAQAARHLAPGGLMVSVQNGLGNLEVVAATVGPERTVGSRVIFGAQITAPGTAAVTVYADKVLLGAFSAEVRADLLAQAAADLNAAGVPTAVVANILTPIWEKVLYNCALNPLAAILGVTYGELGENPHTRRLMETLIREIYQVAQARRVPLSHPEASAYFRHFITRLVPPTAGHYPSMLQDLRAGRRTEIDALNGAICRYAAAAGLSTPHNDTLCHLIRFLESQGRPLTDDRGDRPE